ncbi:chorismate mutase AroH [Halolactibacillus alkaliphilus]|uniref:chorismate mutase n=1 Tax=Halolactibacillus alkaliphilus TaxID=442899 RepID=A0A511X153_9BACI|nr:chorismate mutase [Halolactibacillus alkaliphilus]GEN56687.1 chorismate mutase AroH [Halolactibacillus alkaliphilus]GGN70126.1 chorismate mutase AroH [Halolactibacillus alkaliphilus]SFO77710.1 chorismate mutase [Halolactibacillus alkaliphilus]
MIRGIRGATTVSSNEQTEIYEKTKNLLDAIVSTNNIEPEDVAHVLVSVTDDINQAFPARPIREKEGWTYVPVMCMKEIDVPNGLPYCIRLMLTVNTDQKQTDIVHIYQEEAVKLRPDLVEGKA